jgi:5'-nucleotidase
LPTTFPDTLVVGVSSRALFDLDEANAIFEQDGIAAYRQYMTDTEDVPLGPGTAFPLVQALLSLNRLVADNAPSIAE